jgi:hypothetical protein
VVHVGATLVGLLAASTSRWEPGLGVRTTVFVCTSWTFLLQGDLLGAVVPVQRLGE